MDKNDELIAKIEQNLGGERNPRLLTNKPNCFMWSQLLVSREQNQKYDSLEHANWKIQRYKKQPFESSEGQDKTQIIS